MDGIKLASIKELTKRQDNVEIAQSNIENKQAEIKKELQAIKDIKSEIEKIINAK